MMPTLDERAESVRARNRVLESVPGSGFHDNDRDVHGKLAAPHMRHMPGGMNDGSLPLPRISEHVVAFMDERDIHFSGPDASRVLDALTAFRAKLATRRIVDLEGTEAKMMDVIPRLAIKDGVLSVWREDWNDILFSLDAQQVGVSCAPFIPDGTTP